MKWQQTTTTFLLLIWSSFLVANKDAFCWNPNAPSLPISKRFLPATNARTTSSRTALHGMNPSDNDNSNGGQSPLSGVAPKSSTVVAEPPNSTTPKTAPRLDRRSALHSVSSSLVLSLLGSGLVVAATTTTVNAFDKTFPLELTGSDPQKSLVDERISLTKNQQRYSQGSRSTAVQRAAEAAATAQRNQQNVAHFNVRNDGIPSVIWGGALWLLSGSRSNPLATPLANVLYEDSQEEPWLQDRNAGLFADFPLPLYLVLAFVFLFLGVVTQYGLLQLLQGDADVTLQWAEVTLMAGGFLELGRIASGEKLETRIENNRSVQLQEEFEQFATARLDAGGGGGKNCHRSDVVASFRRYYGKYRQADNAQYPLTDLEIEKLLRAWNRGPNRGRAEMTSAGFYYGISINKDADVFVQK